eukprot:TRINITY_DN18542_c0_g1_i1.p1 TRINITY_DN18542_c0_g1~~TRINITY_DN18542_c0_g1_i1.p1  ORF type:complete len:144 (-),score=16.91 TRINITY_DN18542_c0_g1_i1:33-431(-)
MCIRDRAKSDFSTIHCRPWTLDEVMKILYRIFQEEKTKQHLQNNISDTHDFTLAVETPRGTKNMGLSLSVHELKNSVAFLLLFVDMTTKFENHKLRQISEYKSRLLASVSHELRTPLNGCLLYTSPSPRDQA